MTLKDSQQLTLSWKWRASKGYVSQRESNIKESNGEFNSEYDVLYRETRVSNLWNYFSNCFHQNLF